MARIKRLPRGLTAGLPQDMPRGKKIKELRERMALAKKVSNKPSPRPRKEVIAQLAIRGKLGAGQPYKKMTELIKISESASPYKGLAK